MVTKFIGWWHKPAKAWEIMLMFFIAGVGPNLILWVVLG